MLQIASRSSWEWQHWVKRMPKMTPEVQPHLWCVSSTRHRIHNIWNYSPEVHHGWERALVLPIAGSPSTAVLGERRLTPLLVSLLRDWPCPGCWGRIFRLSCASSQATTEPFLGDEDRCVQKTAHGVSVVIFCYSCINIFIVQVAHFLPLIDTIKHP